MKRKQKLAVLCKPASAEFHVHFSALSRRVQSVSWARNGEKWNERAIVTIFVLSACVFVCVCFDRIEFNLCMRIAYVG